MLLRSEKNIDYNEEGNQTIMQKYNEVDPKMVDIRTMKLILKKRVEKMFFEKILLQSLQSSCS